MGHDADPHRRLRGRRVRIRRAAPRERRHRQRGRHRARRPGRDRGLGAGLPRGLLADRAASTRSASRVARSCRRRSTATCSAASARPPSSTSSRATRRGCATSPSGSARCGRSGPRRRSPVPLIEADLRLEDGRLKGTVKNASTQALERPAVVLGQTVAVLDDLEPGAEASVDVAVQFGQFTQSLSDKVVGQMLRKRRDHDTGRGPDVCSPLHGRPADATTRTWARPTCCSADGPVVLAWGSNDLLPVEIAGQKPRHLGNVLYYLPARLAISGKTTFRADMLRSTVVESDAVVFNRDADNAQLRPRLGHARLSAGRLRGPDRCLTADHRPQLRRDRVCPSPRSPSSRSPRSRRPCAAVGRPTVQACRVRQSRRDRAVRHPAGRLEAAAPLRARDPVRRATRRPATSIRRRERC